MAVTMHFQNTGAKYTLPTIEASFFSSGLYIRIEHESIQLWLMDRCSVLDAIYIFGEYMSIDLNLPTTNIM